MDCTAAVLKACARSRSKWCRHKRSASARAAFGCCWGCSRGGVAPAVIGDASSFLHRLLVYACCCGSSEESSELCREWVDPPAGEGGRGEDEGEKGRIPPGLTGFWFCLNLRFSSVVLLTERTTVTSTVVVFKSLFGCSATETILLLK